VLLGEEVMVGVSVGDGVADGLGEGVSLGVIVMVGVGGIAEARQLSEATAKNRRIPAASKRSVVWF
jgi:hypothetical protein